jgi:ABC-2 type transport system ATP-binding protein
MIENARSLFPSHSTVNERQWISASPTMACSRALMRVKTCATQTRNVAGVGRRARREIPMPDVSTDATPYTVETVALSRRFDRFVAVDALDLAVRRAAIFGLLGSNGAGKSTTIRMLTTLLPPTGGSARVAGYDVVGDPRAVRAHIGYVPQMVSADGELTARENLLIAAKLYGVPRHERDARITEALAFMGLADFTHVLVARFSGGMIRRLELAQAMLHRPRVLFLDEPTIGLDPVARRAVWDRIRELRDRYGTTILMTTHDMEEADALCETVAFLHLGRLVASGEPSRLKRAIGPTATLDDVFIRYAGGVREERGEYADVKRTRRTAERLA